MTYSFMKHDMVVSKVRFDEFEQIDKSIAEEFIWQIEAARKFNDENAAKLERRLLTVLGERTDDYSFYIKVIGEDFELGHQEDELFYPASMYKVPIAILILKDIDEGKYSLDDELTIQDRNKFYTSDQLYHEPSGTSLTVKELLRYMIVFSDNTAWDMLMDNLLGKTHEIDARIESELGLELTQRVPFQSTARELGEVYEGLYYNRYLSQESNEYLMELLTNITESQNDRIPSGLPVGTKVAHKIGTWIGIYEDGGIVFGEKFDYVIVIMNRDTSTQQAIKDISKMSEIVWEFIEGE